MLKKNKNLSIIAGLMFSSICLTPFIMSANQRVHADTAYTSAIQDIPQVHNSKLAPKQQKVLTLQQRILNYQHSNNIKTKNVAKLPAKNKNVLQGNVKDSTADFEFHPKNKNVIADEHPTTKDQQQIKGLNHRLINRLHIANQQVKAEQQQAKNQASKYSPMLQTKQKYQHIKRNLKRSKGFKNTVRITHQNAPQNHSNVKPYHNFSKKVLQYKPYLDQVCRHYHMRNYEVLMMSIMETESHGNGKDIMQASASLGKKPNSLNPQQSIEQSVIYMRNLINHAQRLDQEEHNSLNIKPNNYHHYATDSGLLAQSYNYGGNFLDYVKNKNQGFNINIARNYSKNVVAPLFGNNNQKTYPYNNPLSQLYKSPYLYKSGGNYLYGMMVDQYISNGTLVQPILNNLYTYNNNHYVYGGKNPDEGFDASGLTSYGFRHTYHIHMPRNINGQWKYTHHVSGGINNARPGDLIFFKGTHGNRNHLSHVEIVVNRHLMYGATSSGIGFHYINNPYWIKHYAGVRRIHNYWNINRKTERELNRQAQSYSNNRV